MESFQFGAALERSLFLRSESIKKVVENVLVIIHRRQNTLKKYLSFEIGWYNLWRLWSSG